jgi:hypothetical protein
VEIGNKVIAGYLEKDGEKLYSSIIIKMGEFYKNIRKEKRWRDEFINDSNQLPSIINIPIFNKTLVLVCYDARRYSEMNIEEIIKENKIDSLIVLSYWKNNFNILLDSINKIGEIVKPEKIICFDFFHGFHLLKF